MVFTVDVGNTNIVLSGYKNDEIVFTSHIATETSKMEDQYAIDFLNILNLYGYEKTDFNGAIISTVVPPLIPVLHNALKKLFSCEVIVVGPGVKTGLNIKIDDPATLGGDMVCGAVGAISKYKCPMIIFDLGTATTISAIDEKGCFIGGSILPGVLISLQTLSQKTAQLPQVNTQLGDLNIIGTNTIDCMKSGVVFGNASMVDGMIRRYREVLGQDATVVVTGGLAQSITEHCKEEVILDKNLLSDGLYQIYKKNAE